MSKSNGNLLESDYYSMSLRCLRISIYIYTHMYVFIDVCIYLCIYLCMYLFIDVCIYLLIYYIQIYIYVCIYSISTKLRGFNQPSIEMLPVWVFQLGKFDKNRLSSWSKKRSFYLPQSMGAYVRDIMDPQWCFSCHTRFVAEIQSNTLWLCQNSY